MITAGLVPSALASPRPLGPQGWRFLVAAAFPQTPGIGSPAPSCPRPACTERRPGDPLWPQLGSGVSAVRCAEPQGEDRGGRQQVGRRLGSGAALRVLQGAKINPTRRIRFPNQNNPAAALEMRNGKMIPGVRQGWRR